MKVHVGDLDGDLDVDILHGEKVSLPRVMTNRLQESGALAFRDRSHAVFVGPNWAPGKGSYEQDLGDLDDDGDLDIYGTAWDALAQPPIDLVFESLGATFAPGSSIAVPYTDQGEPDFLDFDNDGDLDLFICAEYADERLVENAGPGGGYALARSRRRPAGRDPVVPGCRRGRRGPGR